MASRYKRHVYVCKRAYSCPRIELEPPVHPSPVFRVDLVLPDTVHTLVVAVIRESAA